MLEVENTILPTLLPKQYKTCWAFYKVIWVKKHQRYYWLIHEKGKEKEWETLHNTKWNVAALSNLRTSEQIEGTLLISNKSPKEKKKACLTGEVSNTMAKPYI